MRRILLGVVGLAMVIDLAGVVMGRWPAGPGALALVVVFMGLLLERWRYHPHSRPDGRYQATAERFHDPETGVVVTVYVDPVTGDRRYVPEGGAASPHD